jgi:hypothetical protein
MVVAANSRRQPRSEYYRLLAWLYTGDADVQELTDTQDRYDNHYVERVVWSDRAVCRAFRRRPTRWGAPVSGTFRRSRSGTRHCGANKS